MKIKDEHGQPSKNQFRKRCDDAVRAEAEKTEERLAPLGTRPPKSSWTGAGYDLPGKEPVFPGRGYYPGENGIPGLPTAFPDPFLFPGYTAEDDGGRDVYDPRTPGSGGMGRFLF